VYLRHQARSTIRKATTDFGVRRALYAAGFRPGELVHNTFSYHFTPAGFMLDLAAQVLGRPVFPAGGTNRAAGHRYRGPQAGVLFGYTLLSQDHSRKSRRDEEGRRQSEESVGRRGSVPAKRPTDVERAESGVIKTTEQRIWD
jgi:hypothetical protein